MLDEVSKQQVQQLLRSFQETVLKADAVQELPSLGNKDEGFAKTESLASLFFLGVASSSTGLNGVAAISFGGNLIFGP